MSTQTLQSFIARVENDNELQAKVGEIFQRSGQPISEELAELSRQAGTPVSASEISEALKSGSSELSESELEAVSGGVGFSLRRLFDRGIKVQNQGNETKNNSV